MTLSKMGAFAKAAGIGSTTSVPTAYLDTGYPPLNKIISGNWDLGLPAGQIVQIVGASASGKTMISTQLMISAQKQNGFAAFFDHETAFQLMLAEQQGLITDDEDKFMYIPAIDAKGEIVSFETSIKNAIALAKHIRDNEVIAEDAPIVFVFDSLASMLPQAKLVKEADEMTMNDSTMLARVTSQLFPIISQVFKKYNVTAIFINQLRDTLKSTGGPGGAPITSIPGGKAAYYYSSTVLILSGSKLWSSDKAKLLGNIVTCKTDKTRNTRPHQQVKWNFVFEEDGTGHFDAIGSYTDYLKEIGVIVSAGPRVEWEGGKPFLSQVKAELAVDPIAGMEKLKRLHKDHRDAKATT